MASVSESPILFWPRALRARSCTSFQSEVSSSAPKLPIRPGSARRRHALTFLNQHTVDLSLFAPSSCAFERQHERRSVLQRLLNRQTIPIRLLNHFFLRGPNERQHFSKCHTTNRDRPHSIQHIVKHTTVSFWLPGCHVRSYLQRPHDQTQCQAVCPRPQTPAESNFSRGVVHGAYQLAPIRSVRVQSKHPYGLC